MITLQELTMNPSIQPALDYLAASAAILEKIQSTQMDALAQAADLCAASIAGGGLVHLFGTGHSRIMVEEMFPRHGSFPGFHPIVELSLTYHNEVVGANGQRQAMFLEHVEGLAAVILKNFNITSPDSFMIFSHSGVNEVVVDMALEVRKLGIPLVVVTSVEYGRQASARHSSGKKLIDLADVLIDTCTPPADALVHVPGLPDPVGPGSTIGGALVVNALKSLIAARLTEAGQPPIVLTSAFLIGPQASARQFDLCYDDYRNRIQKVYGCSESALKG
jgi:uncharacterized phosphosugar-binding protein